MNEIKLLNYYDLSADDSTLDGVLIEVKDDFNCIIKDSNNIEYNGFILASSQDRKTLCEISFQKSATDKKYQVRPTFKRTKNNFETVEADNRQKDYIQVSFKSGEYGYRQFWKMVAFLYQWREIVNLDEFQNAFTVSNADIIKSINDKNVSEILNAVIKNGIDVNEVGKILAQRNQRKAIDDFEEMINGNKPEADFQKFFENNKWFLGHALEYDFLDNIKKGAKVKDSDGDDGKGERRADFKGIDIMSNAVLVEIKKPETSILGDPRNAGEAYYPISTDLAQAISQIQHYMEHYPRKNGIEVQQMKENFIVCYPRGIVIIGHSRQMNNKDKVLSFERFKKHIHNIDIIFYDTLLNRARKITGYEDGGKTKQNDVGG